MVGLARLAGESRCFNPFSLPRGNRSKVSGKDGAMTDFFRFPRTPHLVWLGKGQPRDDKVLSPADAQEILRHEIVIEEKVDGANLGFSLDDQGELRVQNRGTFLSPETCHPQFKPLFRWIEFRRDALISSLSP